MLLSNFKIQTRRTTARPLKSKNSVKAKASLPETEESAKAIFQHMPLTGSHDLQRLQNEHFQLNVISPSSENQNPEIISTRFNTPEWIIASNIKSPSGPEETTIIPLVKIASKTSSEGKNKEFSFGSDEVEETHHNDHNDCTELQPNPSGISESPNKHISFNSQQDSNNYELEHRSAYALNPISSDEERDSLGSVVLKKGYKSTISHRGLGSSIKGDARSHISTVQELQVLQQEQLEKLSEYGLNPKETNRLKKIQEFQKKQFKIVSEKDSDSSPSKAEPLAGRNLIHKKNKDRKCSQAIQSSQYCDWQYVQLLQKAKQKKTKGSLSKRKDSMSSLKNLKKIQSKKA